MAFLNILLGFACLTIGGDVLVRGAVASAQRFGVSTLMIGLVLVGFGTSTPELVTSMRAMSAEAPGLVIGNVIGSNIANILLILGCAAVIAPLRCCRDAFRRDGPMLAIATLIVAGAALTGTIDRFLGAVFVTALVIYILVTYLTESSGDSASARMHEGEASLAASNIMSLPAALGLTAAGIALVLFGADRMVTGSITLARGWGVSETIIGLTIVALGTSLPELATSVMAALRKEADVAFGSIVGSCIFNLLGILGLTALIFPIGTQSTGLPYDLLVMGLATAWLIFLVAWQGRITRTEGTLFLLGYTAYGAYLYARAHGAAV